MSDASKNLRALYNWKPDQHNSAHEQYDDDDDTMGAQFVPESPPDSASVHLSEPPQPPPPYSSAQNTNTITAGHNVSDGTPIGTRISIGMVCALVVFFLLFKIDRYLSRKSRRVSREEAQDGTIASVMQMKLDAEALERKEQVLNEVTTTVKKEDLADDDMEALEAGTRPHSSCMRYLMPPEYTGDNNCAICLGEYDVGDKITGSPNDECTHAFHYECILDWLTRDNTNCPCCRVRFIPVDVLVAEDDKAVTRNSTATSMSETDSTSSDDDDDEQTSSEDATELSSSNHQAQYFTSSSAADPTRESDTPAIGHATARPSTPPSEAPAADTAVPTTANVRQDQQEAEQQDKMGYLKIKKPETGLRRRQGSFGIGRAASGGLKRGTSGGRLSPGSVGLRRGSSAGIKRSPSSGSLRRVPSSASLKRAATAA